jgi:hypothetical protein
LGQQIGKQDQAGILISNVFDLSGQLTSLVMPSVPDPENGGATNSPTWTYLYDQYSRQYAMQDAKGWICARSRAGLRGSKGWTPQQRDELIYTGRSRATKDTT